MNGAIIVIDGLGHFLTWDLVKKRETREKYIYY